MTLEQIFYKYRTNNLTDKQACALIVINGFAKDYKEARDVILKNEIDRLSIEMESICNLVEKGLLSIVKAKAQLIVVCGLTMAQAHEFFADIKLPSKNPLATS